MFQSNIEILIGVFHRGYKPIYCAYIEEEAMRGAVEE